MGISQSNANGMVNFRRVGDIHADGFAISRGILIVPRDHDQFAAGAGRATPGNDVLAAYQFFLDSKRMLSLLAIGCRDDHAGGVFGGLDENLQRFRHDAAVIRQSGQFSTFLVPEIPWLFD